MVQADNENSEHIFRDSEEPGAAALRAIAGPAKPVLSPDRWRSLATEVAERHGLKLYDIEVPPAPHGSLRIFVWRGVAEGKGAEQQAELDQGGDNATGVAADAETGQGAPSGRMTVADCARVSREILNSPSVEQELPERWIVEVSSPGVNRRLRTAEHMAGAVGERISFLVEGESERIFGKLIAFQSGTLRIAPEMRAPRAQAPKWKQKQQRGAAAKQFLPEREISWSLVTKAHVDFDFD